LKIAAREQKNIPKNIGLTRIRTGVVRIKTESDNHYTIKPLVIFYTQKFFAVLYKSPNFAYFFIKTHYKMNNE
jgi:hypothetical protein